MLRRFIIVGLAAAFAAPILAVTPAPAAILFSCSGVSGTATITPGISHTQTAQTDLSGLLSLSGCTNGQTGSVGVGSGAGLNTITTFPPRPVGCPVAAGGAGPDYPENTPLLTGPDPTFSIDWASGADSTGIAKLKAANPANITDAKVVLVITVGQYLAPAGQKTKIKGSVTYAPVDTGNCADDTDPFSSLTLTSSAGFIVQQK